MAINLVGLRVETSAGSLGTIVAVNEFMVTVAWDSRPDHPVDVNTNITTLTISTKG